MKSETIEYLRDTLTRYNKYTADNIDKFIVEAYGLCRTFGSICSNGKISDHRKRLEKIRKNLQVTLGELEIILKGFLPLPQKSFDDIKMKRLKPRIDASYRSAKCARGAYRPLRELFDTIVNALSIQEEEKETLVTFMCRRVFRYEDTDGEALDYEEIELPELPLLETAKEWGITVRAIPGNYRYHGYYSPSQKSGFLSPLLITHLAGEDRVSKIF
jgi:hypothetical protein